MQNTDQQEVVVENFLGSLDIEIPMVYHFKNCMRDAMLYKWNSSLVIRIMSEIEKAYGKK